MFYSLLLLVKSRKNIIKTTMNLNNILLCSKHYNNDSLLLLIKNRNLMVNVSVWVLYEYIKKSLI